MKRKSASKVFRRDPWVWLGLYLLIGLAAASHAEEAGASWAELSALQAMPTYTNPNINGQVVVYDDRLWCLVEEQARSAIALSLNGIDWHTTGLIPPMTCLAALPETLLGFDDASQAVHYSQDGRAWTTEPQSSWPPIADAALVALGEQIWSCGASNANAGQGEVWAFAPEDGWRQMVADAPFGERSGASLTVLDGALYLFGGRRGDSAMSDLWRSQDGVAWEQVPTTDTEESCFNGTLIAWNHALYLYTAALGTLEWPNLCQLLDGGAWHGNVYRIGYKGHPVVFNDALYLVGGRETNIYSHDGRGSDLNGSHPSLRAFKSTDGLAFQAVTGTVPWLHRTGMGAAVHDGHMWLAGGDTYHFEQNDMWRSANGTNWELVTDDAAWSARHGHSLVSHGGSLFLLGGQRGRTWRESPDYFADVWRSEDGVSWTRVAESAAWATRSGGAALSYGGALWYFGGKPVGQGELAPRKAVWKSLDGVDWTLVSQDNDWIVESEFAVAVHAGRMWLAGGEPCEQSCYFQSEVPCCSPTAIYSSTDGITWGRAPAPLDDGLYGKVYPTLISHEESLVLLGGWDFLGGIPFNSYKVCANDVWTSPDGLAWSRVAASAPWHGRMRAAGLSHGGRIYVLGGEDFESLYGDVWVSSDVVPGHPLDTARDHKLSLSELLRLVQFYNVGAFGCAAETEDGYVPGEASMACPSHASDYSPQDWQIGISELLRAIQLYTATGYHPCAQGEDGFCPIWDSWHI